MLVDAHAHLDHYADEQLDQVIAEIEAQRIMTWTNSMDRSSFVRNQAIAARSEWIVTSFGIHPWRAAEALAHLDELEPLIEGSLLIGEIGLDTVWAPDGSYPAQRTVFEFFLDIARRQNQLLNLHTKGAEAEILDLLDRYEIQRGIIHWYSGPLDIFEALVERGFYFTIGVEVDHSELIQNLARRIPLVQLLTETDNPSGQEWLTGKVGRPADIQDVVSTVARLRGLSPVELQDRVQQNWLRLVPGHVPTQMT